MSTAAKRPLRGQFDLRWLFAWTTAIAVAVAACSGAYGSVVQTIAVLYLLFPLLLLVATILIGGPWLVLVSCCRLTTKLARKGMAAREYGAHLVVSDKT